MFVEVMTNAEEPARIDVPLLVQDTLVKTEHVFASQNAIQVHVWIVAGEFVPMPQDLTIPATKTPENGYAKPHVKENAVLMVAEVHARAQE